MKAYSAAGVTLLEMLVVIAIVGILARFAFPSFNGLLLNSRQISYVNQFIAAINQGRTEAVKQSLPVTICIADTTATNPSCSTSLNWNNGWLMFIDKGTLGSFTSGTDILLRKGMPAATGISVTSTGLSSYLSFLPTGFANTASFASGSSSGTLLVCAKDNLGKAASSASTLSFNLVGRVSITSNSNLGCP